MSSKKEYIPIFVGSTYSDLIDYRKSVEGVLHKMKTIVNGMEYFGSKPGTPLEECLKAVRDSKIYIGLFAMRYGSIEPNNDKSFTHLEYLEAQRLKLPSLIYIFDEEKQTILYKNIDTGEKAKKLKELKEELKNNFMVSFFTTPEDLATKISQDLPPVLQNIGVIFKDDDLETQNVKELISKFMLRPKKYAGSEIIVKGIVDSEAEIPFSSDINTLSLTLGDTIRIKIKTDFHEHFWLFAEGNMADEIEKYHRGDSLILKLVFLFGETDDFDWTDEGGIHKRGVLTGFKITEIRTGAN